MDHADAIAPGLARRKRPRGERGGRRSGGALTLAGRYSPRVTSLVKAALAIAIVLVTHESFANSRYPASKHVLFSPQDPSYLAVRVTYGMLVSRDRGQTWRLICEAAIGAGGNQDPMYALTPGGVFIGSLAEGLAVSGEGGCSWEFAPSLERTPFVDVAGDPSDRRHVAVFASSLDTRDAGAVARFRSSLWETTDEGKTFAPLGGALDPSWFGETLDLAPNDPARIYLSAERDPETAPLGIFAVSRDGAVTWETYDIPFVGAERRLFIAGVSPTDADRVYLRTWAGEDAAARLLVSDDGGKSFRTIFTGKGPLAAFALSPDGATVWVGGRLDGVNAAKTSDFLFEPRSALPVECLAVGTDGLWACSDEKNGFVAGVSTDEGRTFAARLHFCDVLGPLECSQGSRTYERCPLTGPIGCIRDEPAEEGTPGGDASKSAPPVAEPPRGGCGCSAVGPAAPLLGTATMILFAAPALLRRRRR